MRFELLASHGLGSSIFALTGLLILCAGATAEAEDRSKFSGSGREFIAIIQAEVAELEAQRDALELVAKASAERAAALQARLDELSAQISSADKHAVTAKAAAAEAELEQKQLELETARRREENDKLQNDIKVKEIARATLEMRVRELEAKSVELEESLAEPDRVPRVTVDSAAARSAFDKRLDELTASIEQRQADLGALEQSLQSRQHDRDELEAQNSELAARNLELRKTAKAEEAMQAEEADKAAASIAAAGAAEAQAKTLRGQLAAIRGEIQSAIDKKYARQREAADAEAKLAAALRGLGEIDAKVEVARNEEGALGDKLTLARKEGARLDQIKAEIERAEGRWAELQARTKATELAELQTANPSSNDAAGVAVAGAAVQPPQQERRSPVAVQAAVGTAPGLTSASAEARVALIADLEAGACVTDALTSALGSINRLTAAALVRGLGGC